MLIRICTEDKKNMPEVAALCAKRFDSFTVYHTTGYWKGVHELSLIIEIAIIENKNFISPNREKHFAELLALDIKALNKQESVLIEYIESTNVLI